MEEHLFKNNILGYERKYLKNGVVMKPPICRICGKDFRDSEEGGLVYFKKRPSDIKWVEKMKKSRMTGHPPYADWFCGEHYEKAKQLENLTIDEALKQLELEKP